MEASIPFKHMKKSDVCSIVRRLNPLDSQTCTFSGLERNQKDAVLVMESRGIINVLMRDGKNDDFNVSPDLLRQFQYLVFVTESGDKPKEPEHDSMVNCLVAGIKRLAIDGVRKMIYPKNINPALVAEFIKRYPNDPYKSLF